jgi:membrane-bound lytic murein transglycosylase D
METRFYVPKLQAVKNIVAQPESFKTRLPVIENHPYFQSVDITRDIDVALAARLAEVKLEDFKALNPSLHRPVILAAGTPQILLPWDNAALFQRNLEAYGSSRLATWTAWVAPSTMKAAEVAKRVGMDEDDLRSLNNIPPRMLVKAGSTLLVPRSDRMLTDVSEHVADNGHVAFAPEVVLKRTTVRARKGESVARLAGRYGVSASSVADWNQFSVTSPLKKGQQVVVYLPQVARGLASRSSLRATSDRSKLAARTAAPRAGAKAAHRSTAKPARKAKR